MNNKKLVFVVDDEKDIRELLSVNLNAAGFNVVEISDGAELLKMCDNFEEKPDIIIMDIMMPGIDGFTACSILKRNEKYKDVPILILTIKGHINDIEMGFKSGADGYIVKPFTVKRVLEKIDAIIKKEKFF